MFRLGMVGVADFGLEPTGLWVRTRGRQELNLGPQRGVLGTNCLKKFNTIFRSSMDPLSVSVVPTGVLGLLSGVSGVPLG